MGTRVLGLTALALAVWAAATPLVADEVRAATPPRGKSPSHGGMPERVAPTPAQDDATLLVVATVGARQAVAVGELGVVWQTDDGGATWRFVPTPVRGTLRSVCFLTDRVGWVVGHETDPFTRLSFGIVLATTDGGATWKRHAARLLPALMHVHFFDLENGVAVGEASSEHPTGVFLTEDGGRTWRGLPGSDFPGWRTACFPTPDGGVVAGLNGRLSIVGNGRMIDSRLDALGQRTLRSVTLRADGVGWLVGDGGLLLRTENSGVVWKEPAETLPRALRDFADFHGVTSVGSRAWIVGSPGSAVWRTTDSGRSWNVVPTGVTAPLHGVRFVDAARGYAVGAFGTILKTENGGDDWTISRGGPRRAATLAINAMPGRVGLELLAKQSGDQGYRAAVVVPSRPDIAGGGTAGSEFDLRLNDAVVRAGGSTGAFGWRFPLAAPGLETNSERLLADWHRRTEGRLPQVLLGSFTALIRTWRPTVVVLDQPAADDAATSVLNDAVRKAVEQASDATRHPAQIETAGLNPWNVERIWLRLPDGSQGQASIDPHEFLPRTKRTVREAASPSMKTLTPDRPAAEGRRTYRLLWERDAENGPVAKAPRDFFAGIALVPDGDARRALLPLDETTERERKLAERQRNFHAIAEGSAGDLRKGAQLIGQLRESTAGMRDEQAAMQLAELALEFSRQSRWDLVEATRLEMVERFPDEPATIEAMRWLFQAWAGAEPTWRRARTTTVSRERFETNVDRVLDNVAKVERIAATDPKERDLSQLDTAPDPLAVTRADGRIQVGADAGYDAETAKMRGDQAVRMASLLRKKDAALFRQPEIQFPLAALMRRRGVDSFADTLYRRQQQGSESGPWRTVAEAELWLVQPVEQPRKPVHLCKRTTERPKLDGVLSDACWLDAAEIRLRPADAALADDDYSIVFLARDAGHLYVAGSFRRHEHAPDDVPEKQGRTHDADLSRHDRVAVHLDVDRDYATWYTLQVDQRGFTADACWNDPSWNPKWFVAAAADETHWRFEAAIPFGELGPEPPGPGDVWAAGVVRTIPAVGLESWTAPAAAVPRPDTFGLVRFP